MRVLPLNVIPREGSARRRRLSRGSPPPDVRSCHPGQVRDLSRASVAIQPSEYASWSEARSGASPPAPPPLFTVASTCHKLTTRLACSSRRPHGRGQGSHRTTPPLRCPALTFSPCLAAAAQGPADGRGGGGVEQHQGRRDPRRVRQAREGARERDRPPAAREYAASPAHGARLADTTNTCHCLLAVHMEMELQYNVRRGSNPNHRILVTRSLTETRLARGSSFPSERRCSRNTHIRKIEKSTPPPPPCNWVPKPRVRRLGIGDKY